MHMPTATALSDDDFDELEHFLVTSPNAEVSLDLDAMDGFFAALLSSPRMVMPREWLPWVWDSREGKSEPHFKGLEHANRILGLIMGFYNMVAMHLAGLPDVFEPVFKLRNPEMANSWRKGYLAGMRFDQSAWTRLMEAEPALFEPILHFGEESNGKAKGQDVDLWTREVGMAVAKIHRDSLSKRPVSPQEPKNPASPFGFHPPDPIRSPSKVGRNDLCPCGSGKKYKRCCGVN